MKPLVHYQIAEADNNDDDEPVWGKPRYTDIKYIRGQHGWRATDTTKFTGMDIFY